MLSGLNVHCLFCIRNILKMPAPWKKSCDQPRQHIKKQRHYFANKGPSSQSCDFSSSRVWMWELDYEESWVPKNWCFWTVVLEKILESPLDCKVIQLVNPKGNQSWIFIGRTDAEAKTPILWPPDVKDWLIWKDPAAGKDWRQEEKRTTEDEMVAWNHQLYRYEVEQAPGVGDDGQGSLACMTAVHGVSKSRTRLRDWTELIPSVLLIFLDKVLLENSHAHVFNYLWNFYIIAPEMNSFSKDYIAYKT